MRLSLLIFFLSSYVHAQTQGPPGTQPVPTTTTNTTTTQPITLTPSTNTAAVQSQGQNQSSGGQANAIGTALLAAGTAMMAACAPKKCSCCPAAAQMIAMGLQGLAQGKANNGASGAHGLQAGQSVSAVNPYGSTYDTRSPDLSRPTDFSGDKDVIKKLSELSKYGVSFDPKKNEFSLPNGKSFKVDDATNPSAMSSAGVSSGEFKSVMDRAQEEAKKAAANTEKIGASTATNGFESGAGGSYGSAGSLGASDNNQASTGGSAGGPIKRDPAFSVAGMKKNYNGDNIGVSGDDIFSMMARRYREKSKSEAFLPPESQPQKTAQSF